MEQLRDILKEVLSEELKPIHVRLDSMETHFTERFDKVENRIEQMDGRLERIELAVNRMEAVGPSEIMDMLKINLKT